MVIRQRNPTIKIVIINIGPNYAGQSKHADHHLNANTKLVFNIYRFTLPETLVESTKRNFTKKLVKLKKKVLNM